MKVTLLKALRRRFFVPVPVDIVGDSVKVQEFRLSVEKRIQLKVVKALRDWMNWYWEEDMSYNEELQKELSLWLKEMERVATEKLTEYPWKSQWLTVVQRQYDIYKVHSPGHDQRTEMAQWERDEETGVPLKLKTVSIKKGFKLSNTTAEELAEQITLMDFATFSRIGSRECIGQCWKKDKENARNVLALINQVCTN